MRLLRQIVSFTIAWTPVAFSQTLVQGAAEVPSKQPIAQSQTIDVGAPQQRLWLRRCCFSGRGSDRIARHPPGSRVTARPTSTSWVASTASRRRCCLAARTVAAHCPEQARRAQGPCCSAASSVHAPPAGNRRQQQHPHASFKRREFAPRRQATRRPRHRSVRASRHVATAIHPSPPSVRSAHSCV